MKKIDNFIQTMKNHSLNNIVIDTFSSYYQKLCNGESGKLSKQMIKAPQSSNVINYQDLPSASENYLNELAVIKLNGGLGTSMGLKKAKSLLPVKEGLSFLDIIAKQILYFRKQYSSNTPLLFMNSFNTQNDTLNALNKYPELFLNNISIDFLQNKFPKIRQDNLLPLEDEDDALNWNPPGHGDIYTCLAADGVIDTLINAGIKYLFVSNSDNLGATIDLKILTYMKENKIPFIMEVCQRTEMDKKGGHLAEDYNGNLILRESAQCPDDEINEFQDIKLFSYFNTNNLWIDLPALKNYLKDNNNVVNLPLIISPKSVNGVNVFQLETAMGSAINLFKGAKAICVGRERFLPVKKTQDLLLLWSDIYTLKPDFTLCTDLSKEHFLDLDNTYYSSIDDLIKRFPHVPSLIDCESLSVKGDISFSEELSFKGKISLSAKKPLTLSHLSINN